MQLGTHSLCAHNFAVSIIDGARVSHSNGAQKGRPFPPNLLTLDTEYNRRTINVICTGERQRREHAAPRIGSHRQLLKEYSNGRHLQKDMRWRVKVHGGQCLQPNWGEGEGTKTIPSQENWEEYACIWVLNFDPRHQGDNRNIRTTATVLSSMHITGRIQGGMTANQITLRLNPQPAWMVRLASKSSPEQSGGERGCSSMHIQRSLENPKQTLRWGSCCPPHPQFHCAPCEWCWRH